MSGGVVRCERRDGVATMVLSNPERRNALTPSMLASLTNALGEAEGDPDVRVAVISGEGSVFSSGFDFGSFPTAADLGDEDDVTRAAEAIARSRLATIALLNGDTLGAALDLALAADFRLAVSSARLGITAARLGVVYSWQGIARFVDTLGPRAARRLLLTGEVVSASEALALGAVDEVAGETDELAQLGRAWSERLLRSAPGSVGGTKRVLTLLAQSSRLSDSARAEVLGIRRRALESDDLREGLAAFSERRSPVFRGT